MAHADHLTILKQGVRAWNRWRQECPDETPDLRAVICSKMDLRGVDFCGVDLRGSALNSADLSAADLRGADLRGAILTHARLIHARLDQADLSGARVGQTLFVGLELRGVHGLDTLHHESPSFVDTHTLLRAGPRLPGVFLRGCGISLALLDAGAAALPTTLVCADSADVDCTARLIERLRAAHLPVWSSLPSARGIPLVEQVAQASGVYDRIVALLSPASVAQPWRMPDLRARLVLLRLVDREGLRAWRWTDPHTGADLAASLVPDALIDATCWQTPGAFEAICAQVLRRL